MNRALPTLTADDFTSDQEVRWCPGCGDFAILAQIKQVLASCGVPRERIVFVSGIGCSSRLPYYLSSYGLHSSHGRSASVALGIKTARPDLSVWVVTGDGDGLGAGLGPLLHNLRRNVDLKILLFNNEVYGLSKGQSSPTTRPGTLTRTSPLGSTDNPLRPIGLALAAGASFVARTIDVDGEHLASTLRQAAEHRGSAFVEIYQNCKIFNDGVFEYATDRGIKADNVLYLEHQKPLLFGKDRQRGLRLKGLDLESVDVDRGQPRPIILTHDERAESTNLARLLADAVAPKLPECFGIFRRVISPTYEDRLAELSLTAPVTKSFDELFAADDSWTIE